jgi:hypothetical protein
MHAHTVRSRADKRLFYYNCRAKNKHGAGFYQATRTHQAENLEALVWHEVRTYLEEPDRLRADLNRKIELKKNGDVGETCLHPDGRFHCSNPTHSSDR